MWEELCHPSWGLIPFLLDSNIYNFVFLVTYSISVSLTINYVKLAFKRNTHKIFVTCLLVCVYMYIHIVYVIMYIYMICYNCVYNVYRFLG